MVARPPPAIARCRAPAAPRYICLSMPRPTNRPTASHHVAGAAGNDSRHRPQREVQNNSKGKSGVMTIAPAPIRSVAFSSKTAHMPAFRPGSRRSAASHSTTEPRAAESGPSNRTPSAVVAGEPGSGANPKRDHRRMVEIARRQRPRPNPVIGLVGRQRQQGSQRQPQHRQQRERGRRGGNWPNRTDVAAEKRARSDAGASRRCCVPGARDSAGGAVHRAAISHAGDVVGWVCPAERAENATTFLPALANEWPLGWRGLTIT